MAIEKLAFFVAGVIATVTGAMLVGQFGQPDAPQSLESALVSINAEPSTAVAIATAPTAPAEPELGFEVVSSAVLIEELTVRMEEAETRIDELQTELATIRDTADSLPPQQFQDEEFASADQLVNSGLSPFVVDEIASVRDQLQLQRLELRDLATREGWIDTERFRDSISDLRTGPRLRQVIGDDDFDTLLIAEGRNNRVRVDSVITDSAADLSGVSVGDVIYRYAEERIFSFIDLRRASTSGQRDEPVSLQVIRDGDPVDLVIPRGPLGVTLSGFQESE